MIHGFNIVGINNNINTKLDTSHNHNENNSKKNEDNSSNNITMKKKIISDSEKSEISIIYRINERPVKPLSNNYLIVIDHVERVLNGKPASFDIFNLRDFNNYIEIIKQLKRLNRRTIGIEIKIDDIRKSIYSHDVGRWMRCIKDIYKFCKLSDNQFILSSGTNSKYGIISNTTFESVLRVCEIEPQKYWRDLDKWLDIKKKVYYDVTP